MEIPYKKKVAQFLTRKKNGIIIRRKRFVLKMKGDIRPTSYPAIAGDSFRSLASHKHDETSTVVPGAIDTGDIVFVSQGKALNYLQEVHPNILVPYILIVHNGDYTFDERYTSLLDDKIIHCYAQNVTVKHDKVTPLPVALSNFANFEHTNPIYFRPPVGLPDNVQQRKNRFFYRFADETCPSERKPLRAFCKKHPFAETVEDRLSQVGYINLLQTYKFVISPRGNAIDTHRPYEAFHLGTVPIVKDSVTIRSLHEAGLPYWIVKDWEELNGLTEEFLSRKYIELMKHADFSPLHMDYWIASIQKKLEGYRLSK